MTSEMTLLSDPVVAAVVVRDNGEPVAEVTSRPGLRLDLRESAHNPTHRYLRAGLLDRLAQAQASLPAGLHLLVIEGYRPLEVQRSHFAAYRAELAALHPHWNDERLHREASRYISPPEVAPHCTGGAVDLTLCTSDGVELDMGTLVNASPVTSANRCYTEARDIPAEARAHRHRLVTALTEVGLVNYPTEWWHWSFGDRYWAVLTGRESHYGALPVEVVRAIGAGDTSGYNRNGPNPSTLSGST